MSQAQLKGILFDFDGVLISSLTVMRLSFEAAYLDHYGQPGPDEEVDFDKLFEEYRRHLGKGFPDIMRQMGLSIELLPHFKQHSRYLSRYIRTFNGVEALLSALVAEGWVLGIATGKDHARTCELLTQLKLRDYFSVVFGFDSVERPKPAPDMVSAFITQTSVPHARIIMVGDAPSDLQCARNANCVSIAALWGFSDVEVLKRENPTFVATSPLHLLAVCRDIGKGFPL